MRTGGLKASNLRYADDTTLFVTTKESLDCLLGKVKEVSEQFGPFLNLKITKVMTTGVVDNYIVAN